MSEGPWVRPAPPGDSGPGPRARRVDQLSQETRVLSKVPRGRPAVPGHAGLCPRARGFDQLSQANRAWVRGPSGWTSCPGHLGPVPEGARCRPTLPCYSGSGLRSHGRPAVSADSGPCPMSRWVDQLSRATCALVRMTAVSTRRPGRVGPLPEGPRGGPALPGNRDCTRGLVGMSRCHGRLGLVSEVPRGRPDVPGNSVPGPRACGVDQLSWAPGPSPKALGVNQLSPANRAHAQGPAWSTSCPG